MWLPPLVIVDERPEINVTGSVFPVTDDPRSRVAGVDFTWRAG
jgi:hypothetical protein